VRRSIFALCLVLAAGVAAPALGEHVTDPPWVTDPTDPDWAGGTTTSESWGFTDGTYYPHFYPEEYDNPFGEPSIEVLGEVSYVDPQSGQATDPHGNPTGAIHVDGESGTIKIKIANNPPNNPKKVIWLEVTSATAIPPGGITTSPAGTQLPGMPGGRQWAVPPNAPAPDGKCWYTYTYGFEIIPNPASETITIDAVPCTWIEEIVVHTICVVPEPVTIALLAAGACVLLRRKRR